jgi:hypothetical protein
MPITPCFDPTTGASGGAAGGGGGASLYNLPMTEVDLTDGSWVLLDPDGLVDTVSYAGGFNTVTFNAAAATTNHQWVGTSVCTAPRWYKSMQVDGNTVTLLDQTWFVCRMENDISVNDIIQQNVFCSAADPTSTTPTVIGATGGIWSKHPSFSPEYGVVCNNSATVNVNFGSVFAHAAVMQGVRANGSATYIHYDSLNTPVKSGSRNSNILNQAGTNRYIMVGAGTSGAITAGQQVKFSLKYIALTFAGL